LAQFEARLHEIWQTRRLSNMGRLHNELEQALSKRLGASNFRVFNNGTLALQLALLALDVRNEVLTTPFTFPATLHAITMAGARPVFCDIEPDTLCIDPASIERTRGPHTSAIVGVHVYGTPCAVTDIHGIADRYGLKVVYDAAHAFGTVLQGQPIADFGDITMFSFHATKLFHTIEGGGLAFADAALGHKLELLRNFGLENEDIVALVGTNAKLNEIQAAMGIEMLKAMDEEYHNRAQVKRTYQALLDDLPGLKIVKPKPGVTDSLQYMVIRIDESAFGLSRDALHTALKSWNVITRRYFYPLGSDYPSYADCRRDNLPNAERASREVLCLPLYGELGTEMTERIGRIIRHIHSTS
jgi:dTDP-4-amino-4,6-dideoxygalactose transaminase